MRYLSRLFLALAAATLMSGCNSLSDLLTALGADHLVTEGRNIHLLSLGGSGLRERSSASIPGDGLLAGHEIHSMVQAPGRPWVYVGSMNECDTGSPSWCWGNGRIDRFSFSSSGLKWDSLVYEFKPSTTDPTPDCSNDNFGIPGQVGGCAITALAINAKGDRLYAIDEDFQVVLTFGLDGGGTATFLSQGDGARSRASGLAVNPDQKHLYNGAVAYDITTDTATSIGGFIAGDETKLLPFGQALQLFGTFNQQYFAAFDITDPASPNLASFINMGSNGAYDFDTNPSNTLAVVVGTNLVSTIAYDGSSMTPVKQIHTSGGFDIREVATNSRGSAAVAAWWTSFNAGGATVYNIAADGTPTEGDTMTFPQEARLSRRLKDL